VYVRNENAAVTVTAASTIKLKKPFEETWVGSKEGFVATDCFIAGKQLKAHGKPMLLGLPANKKWPPLLVTPDMESWASLTDVPEDLFRPMPDKYRRGTSKFQFDPNAVGVIRMLSDLRKTWIRTADSSAVLKMLRSFAMKPTDWSVVTVAG
jgi:hypothetical protein